ncbi:MAG: 3-keto-5-aminohexanoate cleavage protein [Deltaproteobacteria bacterium]|nr:3-keto-5-aminohexanoate cleavage protein [Deltaproteobacteria bacterium]
MRDKVILTNAISGVLANRQQCPAIPYTPAEYAAEAKRCYEAGAAVVHIHAREDDGSPSFRPERYAEIADAIRAACPLLLNFSTGAIGIPMEQRVGHITGYRPEIGALNAGSLTYAKYSARRKTFVFDMVFANPYKDILFLLEKMNASGVKPELECFDSGHVAGSEVLLEMGALKPPLDFSFILGVVGGMKATAQHLAFQAQNVPAGSTWKVIGLSQEQWLMVAAALSLGGDVRVGLEDNFYLPNGEMARSNGDLVAKAAQMARDVGREPATPEEARRLLGLESAA